MDSLRVLALDASIGAGSVAALVGEEVVAERALDPKMKTARTLAPAMAEVLKEAGWRPKEVALVAVGVGPGSFTGLRIAVTAAKTFAFAVARPVVGVSTLRAIAAQAPGEGEIHAVLDAQRGELFVERFVSGSAADKLCVLSLGEPVIIPAAEWIAGLASRIEKLVVTGPGLARHLTALPRSPHLTIAAEGCWNPQAATIGRLAARDFAAGRSDDPLTLAPVYLRLSYAEEKK